MELIIKLDDDIAKGIRGENECEVEPREIVRSFQATIADAIANGIPLPKGHGRLVDENHVIAELVYRKGILKETVKCGEITKIFNDAVVVPADLV